MTETEQIDRFSDELDRLVERFVGEHDVSVAAVVGALFLKAHQLAAAKDEGDEEGA